MRFSLNSHIIPMLNRFTGTSFGPRASRYLGFILILPDLSRFSVAGTHIVPRSHVTSHDPLVGADIDRREERCRRSGGIGTLVIFVQCCGISQVMPVEVDPPSKITWDPRDDWAEVLRHFVKSGRTDFKPISTTARGWVFSFLSRFLVGADP